jgi:hypothetical protein
MNTAPQQNLTAEGNRDWNKRHLSHELQIATKKNHKGRRADCHKAVHESMVIGVQAGGL